MNTSNFSIREQRNFVREKLFKIKSDKEICENANISRSTLYNWVKNFADEKNIKNMVYENFKERWLRPVQTEYTSIEKLNKTNAILASAVRKIKDKEFKSKIAKTISRNNSLPLSEACEIVGISLEDCNYRPHLPPVDDEIILLALDRLLSDPDGHAKTFHACYPIILKEIEHSTYYQIKQIWKSQREYLKTCKKNAIEKKRLKMLEAGSEEGINWLIVYSKTRLKESTNFTSGTKNRKPDINVSILAIFDENDYSALTIQFSAGKLNEYCVESFLNKSYEKLGRPSAVYFHEAIHNFLEKWNGNVDFKIEGINEDPLTICNAILEDNLGKQHEYTIEKMRDIATSLFQFYFDP